jgi:hypothetical protein
MPARRHVLMRTTMGPEQLIAETALPMEKDLHDVLTANPRLIPSEDLQLGALAVVGRESGLAAGYADLVLVDESGEVCLVEVKKEGNPDTRRVVAQLLDYAAALWNKSLDDLERDVLQPYLASSGQAATSLVEHLASAFEDAASEEPDDTADERIARLQQNLSTGRFALLVAAPEIPESVQRVLEYLNGQGLRLYALEVSYFRSDGADQMECFVPRVVVAPRVADPARTADRTPISASAFLDTLPDGFAGPVERALERLVETGALIEWKSYGPSVVIVRDKKRQVGGFDGSRFWITLKASGGFSQEPFDEAATSLAAVGVGSETKDGWYRTVSWSTSTPDTAQAALDVLVELAAKLAPSLDWAAVDPPIQIAFERNDNNLWVNSVSDLEPLLGHHLRGQLRRAESTTAAGVTLLPLKGDQRGWRPVVSGADAATFWPPNEYQGSYTLEITERAVS